MDIKVAAKSLCAERKRLGITGVVGISKEKLFIYCVFKKDLKKAPREWKGFPVEAKYTGIIVP